MIFLNHSRRKIPLHRLGEDQFRQVLLDQRIIFSLSDPIPDWIDRRTHTYSRVRLTTNEPLEWRALTHLCTTYDWKLSGEKSLPAREVTSDCWRHFSGGSLEILGPVSTNEGFLSFFDETIRSTPLNYPVPRRSTSNFRRPPDDIFRSTPVSVLPSNAYVYVMRVLRYELLRQGFHKQMDPGELDQAILVARTWGNRLLDKYSDDLDSMNEETWNLFFPLLKDTVFLRDPSAPEDQASRSRGSSVRQDLLEAYIYGKRIEKYSGLRGNKNRLAGSDSIRQKIRDFLLSYGYEDADNLETDLHDLFKERNKDSIKSWTEANPWHPFNSQDLLILYSDLESLL